MTLYFPGLKQANIVPQSSIDCFSVFLQTHHFWRWWRCRISFLTFFTLIYFHDPRNCTRGEFNFRLYDLEISKWLHWCAEKCWTTSYQFVERAYICKSLSVLAHLFEPMCTHNLFIDSVVRFNFHVKSLMRTTMFFVFWRSNRSCR